MKNSNINNAKLILLLLFTISSISYSKNTENTELENKIKNYNIQNVCPQLKIWKDKIESNLSTEDKQKIDKLRIEIKEMMPQKVECMQNCLKNNTGGKKHRNHGMWDKGLKGCVKECEINEAKKKYADQLKSIMDNYGNVIKDILDEAKIKNKKWKEDKQNIISEYSDKDDESDSRRHKFKKGTFGINPEKGRHLIAMLLFWNGSCDTDIDDIMDFGKFFEKGVNNFDIKVYPNPFSSKAIISFNLKEQAKVKITLNNSSGVTVKNIFEGNLTAGSHTYDITADNLTPAVYIYNLEINGKANTGKIVLNK